MTTAPAALQPEQIHLSVHARRVRGQGARPEGANHIDHFDGVQISLVGFLQLKPDNVDGPQRRSKGEEIQQGVDIVLHHETARQTRCQSRFGTAYRWSEQMGKKSGSGLVEDLQ